MYLYHPPPISLVTEPICGRRDYIYKARVNYAQEILKKNDFSFNVA